MISDNGCGSISLDSTERGVVIMATASFDTEFRLQDKYVEPFFEAIEHPENRDTSLMKTSPATNQEIERGEQLLKEYFCR